MNYKHSFHQLNYFIVFVILSIVILDGCASNGNQVKSSINNMRSSGQIENQKTQKKISINNQEQTTFKSLPEMTSDEYEASGDIYFKNGDYYMAFVQYEKSLKLRPNNVRIHYKKGLIYNYTKQYEEALKSLQTVIDSEPEFAPAYKEMGFSFFALKKYNEAEELLLKAIRLDSKQWEARNALGNIYDTQKKYDQAFKEYTKAIFLKPNESILYNNLGVSLYRAGRYEESIKAYKLALDAKGPKKLIYNNYYLISINFIYLAVLIIACFAFILSLYFIFQILLDVRIELKKAKAKERDINDILQYDQILDPPSIYN